MEIRLNVSTLSDPNSLMPSVTLETLSTPVVSALVDSGSTHCFVDSAFVNKHTLPTCSIPLLQLQLLDGSSNATISQTIKLSLHFPSDNVTSNIFYVTLLDSSCALVLGHVWLIHYNLSIDWVLGNISFQSNVQQMPVPPAPSSDKSTPVTPSLIIPDDIPTISNLPFSTPPPISFINAAAYTCACKFEGLVQFTMYLRSVDLEKLHSTSTSSDPPPDLSGILEEYHDFADVFSKAKATRHALHRKFDLKIDLDEGTSPPLGTIYSLSPTELDSLCTFINEHLNYGFIRQSSSAHGAPVLFVRKKDGTLRLCVDFHGLNKITKKDRYPLLFISDLLDAPSKAHIYTKIDLCHVYHLVHVAEGDKWKTAFCTCYGSFEWCVMPFSLTNAPATFQRFMNSIFSDLLDDILIYSTDSAAHKKHVCKVLCCLHLHSLYAKLEKCEFHSSSVKYLGYQLSTNSLSMSSNKVKAISNWPEPRKVKDIQSFLGFTNFYHHFIFNYSKIVVPLTRLTHKDAPWDFTPECCSTFLHLKSTFTTTPILTHWVPDTLLVVETDTSDYAIAGILSISCSNGELHLVTFYSCMLTSSELNYNTHDKELLAIFEVFQHWWHYLEGSTSPH